MSDLEKLTELQMNNLPVASVVSAQARSEITARVVAWIRSRWKGEQGDPARWLARHGDEFATVVATAQLEVAMIAPMAVDEALEEQGYLGQMEIQTEPRGFAGMTGSGAPVLALAYGQLRKVAQTIDAGAEEIKVSQVWDQAGKALAIATKTAISDASRTAKMTQIAARERTMWVRFVRPPCCARCAILAGKTASWDVGFQRHPSCDCDAVPYTDWVAGRGIDRDAMVFDTHEYFYGLSETGQNRIFSKSGAQAIRDGGDPSQVVNARKSMVKASDRSSWSRTLEGTTVRGHASEYLSQAYGEKITKQRGRRYRASQRQRMLPEEIYAHADGDRDKALTLLHANGYLRTASPSLSDKFPWYFRDSEILAARARVDARIAKTYSKVAA